MPAGDVSWWGCLHLWVESVAKCRGMVYAWLASGSPCTFGFMERVGERWWG